MTLNYTSSQKEEKKVAEIKNSMQIFFKIFYFKHIFTIRYQLK